MSDAVKLIHAYVLEKAAEEPLQCRVSLYRALAEVMPSEDESKRLVELADELEAIDRASQQFTFNFRRSK